MIGSCLECGADGFVLRGLCQRHYRKHQRNGTLDDHALPPIPRQRRRHGSEAANTPSEGDGFWNRTITPSGAHCRVKRLWGKASQYPCVDCGKSAQEWAYDGTDPDQVYALDKRSWVFFSIYPEFYMPMCKKCHRKRDNAKAQAELYAYRTSIATPGSVLTSTRRTQRRRNTRPPNRRS